MKMNKTMNQFSHAYDKLRDISANQIRNNLNLRRLVIITNLGKNLEENYTIGFSTNRKANQNDTNEVVTSEQIFKKDNALLRDKIVNEEQTQRNKILSKIIGFEDNSFLSNIKRDYLEYEDALSYDNRDFCNIYAHFLRLKNDFINIFYCNYSFAPYTIRLIKFCFFFLFLFYLETLCIGQKYYFEKHFFLEEYRTYFGNNSTDNFTNNNYFSI